MGDEPSAERQNECHITYILAASSPTYPIRESVYHKGWANSITFKNGKEYYGIRLPLGTDFGGPLFFTHYSYLASIRADSKTVMPTTVSR